MWLTARAIGHGLVYCEFVSVLFRAETKLKWNWNNTETALLYFIFVSVSFHMCESLKTPWVTQCHITSHHLYTCMTSLTHIHKHIHSPLFINRLYTALYCSELRSVWRLFLVRRILASWWGESWTVNTGRSIVKCMSYCEQCRRGSSTYKPVAE